jgi:Co/Zn/Cd efflux system component
MFATLAAELALALLAIVCGFAWAQLRRGGLDTITRAGLCVNLVGVALLWLRADKPIEGPILLVLEPTHGLTLADLLAAVPLLLAWRTFDVQLSLVSARLKRR